MVDCLRRYLYFFNVKLVKSEAKMVRVKNVVVEWGMPESLHDFLGKFTIMQKGIREVIFGYLQKKVLCRTILRPFLFCFDILQSFRFWCFLLSLFTSSLLF